jgi:hypothetical protein
VRILGQYEQRSCKPSEHLRRRTHLTVRCALDREHASDAKAPDPFADCGPVLLGKPKDNLVVGTRKAVLERLSIWVQRKPNECTRVLR